MVYPKEFKERVKGMIIVSRYEWSKILDALETGSPMVGYYLSVWAERTFKESLNGYSLSDVYFYSFEEKVIYNLFEEWLKLFNAQGNVA